MNNTGWQQSYKAGYQDCNGRYAGGSEIMHIVPHKGKLYAANGYWTDTRWLVDYEDRQSAQVLRLDSSDGEWEVELELGEANGLNRRYMKGNILKSVTFTHDASGAELPEPENVLVMSAGAYYDEPRKGVVSVWVRNDDKNTWSHTFVKSGSAIHDMRWIPRDIDIYTDTVTGIQRIFLLMGNPGIISGVYDPSQPTKIRWDDDVEFPKNSTVATRPLGIIQANGSLFFAVGGLIYQRINGSEPQYKEIINLGDANTDMGGIRGLSAIPNPNGEGESLIFVWAPFAGSKSQVKRLDPDGEGGYTEHDEANMMDLMTAELGLPIHNTLAAHNRVYPFIHPVTGNTIHIVGFQGNFKGHDHLKWPGSSLYGGALYAIRAEDQTYTVNEVNGPYSSGKPNLVSPRAFALSPFGDDTIFVGGHDCCSINSDEMAWVFKAPLEVAFDQSGISR